MTSCWCREDTVLTDDELGDAIAGTKSYDGLNGWFGKVSTITSYDEGRSLDSWRRD